VAVSRCLASLAVIASGVSGARIARKKRSPNSPQSSKFIGGVPVANYFAAHGGEALVEESVEGDWLVMMKPGTTDSQIAEVCGAYKKGCKRSGDPDKNGVPFIEVTATEKELQAVVEATRSMVKFIEPNQPVSMIPELDEQPGNSASWGLDRVGARGRGGFEGAGVSIFILDTGVRTTHQDFGGRAVPEVDFADGNKVCNGDLECAADRQGHGTHCAGTAAGTNFGVAPKARVHGVKVLGDNGAGDLASILGSIDYLAASDIRPAVGSMSLGGPCPLGFCSIFSAIETAIDAAVAAGVTVVVAGGNSNSDACGFQPAYVPSAITVGSTDSLDARSYFSNYGSCTSLWAPGSNITSATHEDDTGAKTFSGTSMACPHVAGGAALILEEHPGSTAEVVLQRLQARSASNYITDLKVGDTNKMLYIASDAPPPPGNVTAPEPECPGYCFVCWLAACEGCC